MFSFSHSRERSGRCAGCAGLLPPVPRPPRCLRAVQVRGADAGAPEEGGGAEETAVRCLQGTQVMDAFLPQVVRGMLWPFEEN